MILFYFHVIKRKVWTKIFDLLLNTMALIFATIAFAGSFLRISSEEGK